MELSFNFLLQNKMFIPIFSAIFGGIITYTFTKIKDKIKIFTYSYEMNRVALSTEDANFGKIQVTWEGNSVPNLYLATFHLENSSYTDFEAIKARIWCGNNVKLLQDNATQENSTFEIHYTEEYQNKITIPEGQEPTPEQMSFYRNTRDYYIPIFNRGDRLTIQVLCLSEDMNPNVYLDIAKKGVKLQLQYPQQIFWGIPVNILLPWTIVSSFMLTAIPCIFIANIWGIGTTALIIGLFGQFWGAIFYKGVRFIRRAIAF